MRAFLSNLCVIYALMLREKRSTIRTYSEYLPNDGCALVERGCGLLAPNMVFPLSRRDPTCTRPSTSHTDIHELVSLVLHSLVCLLDVEDGIAFLSRWFARERAHKQRSTNFQLGHRREEATWLAVQLKLLAGFCVCTYTWHSKYSSQAASTETVSAASV